MSRDPTLEEIVVAAVTVVIGIGGSTMFLLTDFQSLENSTNNLTRFIWAAAHTIPPTNQFEILLELAVASFGFLSVRRLSMRAAIFVAIFAYFLISFTFAFVTAPV